MEGMLLPSWRCSATARRSAPHRSPGSSEDGWWLHGLVAEHGLIHFVVPPASPERLFSAFGRKRSSASGWIGRSRLHIWHRRVGGRRSSSRRRGRREPGRDSTPVNTYDPWMRRGGVVAGVVIALSGAVWALQGLNSQIVPKSFMTNDRSWIVIGTITFVVGVALATWSKSRT